MIKVNKDIYIGDSDKQLKDVANSIDNNNANLTCKNEVISFTPKNATNHDYFGNCYYYKIGTRVHLHLGLKMNSNSSGAEVITLPKGYRPKTKIVTKGMGEAFNDITTVQITEDGVVTCKSTTYYSMADIEYDAFN